ncbi:MAG: potassium-transporting ATPase subunit F [Bacteroidota bacterium]
MKTLLLLVTTPPNLGPLNTSAYLIGSLIALLILVYLVYTLIKPDKF